MLTRAAAAAVAALLSVVTLLVAAADEAASTACPTPTPGASPAALADVPAEYLELYRSAAGLVPGLDWAVLAGIGKVETDHGRLDAPGVRSGTNSSGAAGPMQFLLSTWAAYGVDGDGDEDRDVYDPADAVPAAALYLRAHGAPTDLQRAVFAYNHAQWYVDKVLAQAAAYRGTTPPADPGAGVGVAAGAPLLPPGLAWGGVATDDMAGYQAKTGLPPGVAHRYRAWGRAAGRRHRADAGRRRASALPQRQRPDRRRGAGGVGGHRRRRARRQAAP